MNRSKLWIIIVVLLLLLNTTVLAMLWFKRPPPPPQGGSAKDFLQKELNLTEDQQQKFTELRKDHQARMKEVMSEMKNLKDALVEKVSSVRADSAGIDSLSKEIAEKERQKDIITVYHFRSFRAILNVDQQKKFDSILKQVMRMMGGPQRPPQGGPPRRGERPAADSEEMHRHLEKMPPEPIN